MIVDTFAGAGGWSEGLRSLGLHDVGLEWDRDCCLTRRAAGHLTVRADVAAYPPEIFAGRCAGLLASPPCQAWSMAGKGDGRRDIGRIHAAVELCRTGWTDAAPAGPWGDPRTPLILQPLRWAWAVRPRWIACEQVPPALPCWEHMADVLRSWGYDARAVRLLASDYGVPQTRLRAFLLASLDGPVRVPEPTHAQRPEADLFGAARLPWVSMAAALGWDGRVWTNSDNNSDDKTYLVETDRPAPTMTERGTRWTLQVGSQSNATTRPAPAPALWFANDAAGVKWVLDRRQDGAAPVDIDRPSPTVTGEALAGGQWLVRPEDEVEQGPGSSYVAGQDYSDSVRITLAEAAVLQGMRLDYPFQGTKTSRFRQCGDLVPPAVARAVVAALRGER